MCNPIVELARDLFDPNKIAERMVWEREQAAGISVENFARFIQARRAGKVPDCSCGPGGMASELARIKINVCTNCADRFDIPAGPYFEEQLLTLTDRAKEQGLLPRS